MVKGDRFRIIGMEEKGTVLKGVGSYDDRQHYMVKMDNVKKYPKVISINGKQIEQINEES